MRVEKIMDMIIGKTRELVGYSWKIEFTRKPTRWCAQTDHNTHTIRYCLPYFDINPPKFLKDIVIHECAHALMGALAPEEIRLKIFQDFDDGGHTYMWEQVAKSLGGTGYPYLPWWIEIPKEIEKELI